jgi:hypothetical protein
MSRGRHRVLLAGTMILALAPAVFAAAHIRIVNEGSSGSLYECDAAACAPARTDNPSRKNLDQMDFYVLPGGCVALASAALRPGGTGIDVECGPAGETTLYRCETGSCRPLTSDVDSSSRPIPLPSGCGGRIHELIVIGAGAATPAFFIECDASSGPAREP